MNNRIFSTLLTVALGFLAQALGAQPQPQTAAGQVFTLNACVGYALENNTDVRKQNLAIIQSGQRIQEVRSGGLPQVNGSVQAVDNLILAKQLIPGEIFGQPGSFIPVQFGVQYAVPLKVEANQMLFNKQYSAAVESAKMAEQLAHANAAQVGENVAYNVASAYFSAILTREQRKITEANLNNIRQSVQVAQVQYDNKMIRRIDLDQLLVSQSNTVSELENIGVGYAQSLDYLKILMGYPITDTLVLAEMQVDNPFELPDNSTASNPWLKLIDQQTALKNQEIKGIRAQFLPSVGLFAGYGYQAQFNELDAVNWIPNAMVGVSVSVPIFDGFKKRHQMEQRRVDLESLSLDRQYAENQLNAQYHNAVRKYSQNVETAQNLQENLKLAERVVDAMQVNYQNGIATLSDLINADTGLRKAQTHYLTAQLQVRVAALDVLRANGSVISELSKSNN